MARGCAALDLGCGPGTFTVALARMVGPSGRVIAADLQPAMLEKVQHRVAQAELTERVALHVCAPDRVGLSARVDFVLAFWMVHEVPSAAALFAEMHETLNPGGKLLLVEPELHVPRRTFETEVDAALAANFKTAGTSVNPYEPCRTLREVIRLCGATSGMGYDKKVKQRAKLT